MRDDIVGVSRPWIFGRKSHTEPFFYIRLRLAGMVCTVLPKSTSRAWSRVNLACVGRWASTEGRGVWAGVEAAEVDLFLLDLKRDMAWIVFSGLLADRVACWFWD